MEEGDRNSSKEVKRGDDLNEEVGPRSGHPKFLRTCKSLGRPREGCGIEDGPSTLRKGRGDMALRWESLCQAGAGMMNHICNGSHSMAASLFAGANEASAVPCAESECCCGEKEVRSLCWWRLLIHSGLLRPEINTQN